MKKILSIIIAVLLFASSATVYAMANDLSTTKGATTENNVLNTATANFTTVSPYTSANYTHYSTFATKKIEHCIDVSEHNGAINWYKIKSMGVSSAIIRVGYRGYGASGTLAEDDYFYDNIEQALEAGIKVGIYFYSQALTTAEATAEAKFALARISKYKFTLPVYYDYEFASVSSGRLDSAWNSGKINKTQMTNNALAFCKTIRDAGYKAGVYASADFLGNQLNTTSIVNAGNTVWLAYYTTNSTKGSYWHNTNHNYEMWQYSSEGKVTGTCGAPSSTWIKVKYGSKTGYVLAFFMNFTGTSSAVSTTDGLNLRSGKGKSYPSLATIPENGKLTVLEYPSTTSCDVNYMYVTPTISAPTFTVISGYRKATVSWNKVTGASFYRVYEYDENEKKYTRLTQTSDLSYSISNLSDYSKHTYLVRAFTATEVGSVYTSNDRKSIYTAPAKPQFSLKSASTSSLTVSWNKVTGASYYRVYKYLSGTEYERLAEVKGTEATLSSLSSGKTYGILVRSFGSNNVASGYTLSDNKSFTTAPKKLSFNISSGSNTVSLSWNKVTGATEYRVYSYDTVAKKYTRIAVLGNVSSYKISSLKNNTQYTYLVRAFNDSGYAAGYTLSDNKSIYTAPTKPTFSVSATGSNSISLSWNKVSGASYYRVYKHFSGNEFQRLTQTTSTNFTINNLSSGENYGLLVRAFNSHGAGSSYSIGDDMLNVKTAPSKPNFNLKASNNSIDISWSKVSGASYYRVYSYNNSTKTYTRIAQTSSLKYTHSSLKNNSQYIYLVRAFYSNGLGSSYTSADRKSISTTLPKVSFTVSSPSSGQAKISFTKVSGAKYYRIYRYISGSEYTRIVQLDSAVEPSFTEKGLESGTKYQYLVRAFTATGAGSAYSVSDNKSVSVK